MLPRSWSLPVLAVTALLLLSTIAVSVAATAPAPPADVDIPPRLGFPKDAPWNATNTAGPAPAIVILGLGGIIIAAEILWMVVYHTRVQDEEEHEARRARRALRDVGSVDGRSEASMQREVL
jgi:hypothetical protein